MERKTQIMLGLALGGGVVAYYFYQRGQQAQVVQAAAARAAKQAAANANPALAAIRQNLKAAKLLAANNNQTDGMFQFGMATNAYAGLSSADQKAIGPEMNDAANAVGMLAIY